MKTLKKNNKGFSLVELIVVILIMAIIAVALAPQVMKWVDESKVSTDNNNKATMKSAIDAAVADYMHQKGDLDDAGYTFYIAEGVLASSAADAQAGTNITGINIETPVNMSDFIAQVLNQQYPAVEQDDDGYFKVEISKNGAVTVTVCGASGNDLSSGT